MTSLTLSVAGHGITCGGDHGLTLGNLRRPLLDVAIERLPPDAPLYVRSDVRVTRGVYERGRRNLVTLDVLWMRRRWIVEVRVKAR